LSEVDNELYFGIDEGLNMGDMSGKLREVGLRPTKQRLLIADFLFSGDDMHVTADTLYSSLLDSNINISLATIYNVLNVFTFHGLLREISIDSSRSYFDTNTKKHYHYYFEKTGKLEDIDKEDLNITPLPQNKDGFDIKSIDIVIRVEG
jgi:Fur family iron response transcriptional regulator